MRPTTVRSIVPRLMVEERITGFADADRFEIRLFGRGDLFVSGRPIDFRAPKKALALLAFLILHRGRNWRRDVAFALWPDAVEEAALANLRRHMALLSGVLPPARTWIEKSRSHVAWIGSSRAFIDIERFESASAEKFVSAVALYAGDLLETLDEQWLVPHRNRLRERHLFMLAGLRTASAARGDFLQAIVYGQEQLRVDPWNEAMLCDLLALRIACGDHAGAVDEYRTFAARLMTELGIRPGPKTLALYEAAVDLGAAAPTFATANEESLTNGAQRVRVERQSDFAAAAAFAGPVSAQTVAAIFGLPAARLNALADLGWLCKETGPERGALFRPAVWLLAQLARDRGFAHRVRAARRKHAAYYEGVAREFHRRYWSDVTAPLHSAMEPQVDEFCAAFRFVMSERDVVRAAELIEFLRPFLLDSGRLILADELCDAVLTQSAGLPIEWQLHCWSIKSVAAYRRGLHAQAIAILDAMLLLAPDEPADIAASAALSMMHLGRLQESRRYIEAQLARDRRGPTIGLCWTIWAFSEFLLSTACDDDIGRALLAESRDIAVRDGHRMLYAITLYQQSRYALLAGDLRGSTAIVDEALAVFAGLHERGKTFGCYAMFVKARLLFMSGEIGRSQAVLCDALDFLSRLGDLTWISRVIEGYAETLCAQERDFFAAELVGTSLSLTPSFPAFPPTDERHRSDLTTHLRSKLGSVRYATAIGVGGRRTSQDACALMREAAGSSACGAIDDT